MADLDTCRFEERAAIMEFSGGLSRFQAETLAAEAQGFKRWEALNAVRSGNTQRGANNGQAMAGQSRQNNMSGVQPRSQEKE